MGQWTMVQKLKLTAKRVLLCPTEGQILQLSVDRRIWYRQHQSTRVSGSLRPRDLPSSWPVEAEMLLGYLAITVISFKTCQFSRHFFSIFPSTYAHQKFDSHFQESLRLKLLFIDIIFAERQLSASGRMTFQHVTDLLTFISVTNFEGGRSEKKKKRPIRYALYLGRLFRQILLSYMNLCRSQLCAQS